MAIDCFLSLSPEFFRERREDYGVSEKAKVKTFGTLAREWLREQFGENVVSAVLHMDEATPHIHATILPIELDKESGRHKLNARSLFGPKQLAGFQESYNKKFKSFGLTYKKGSKAVHKDIKLFYSDVNQGHKGEDVSYECNYKNKIMEEVLKKFKSNEQMDEFDKISEVVDYKDILEEIDFSSREKEHGVVDFDKVVRVKKKRKLKI